MTHLYVNMYPPSLERNHEQGYGRRDIPHEPISAILDILCQKKTPSIGCGHSVVADWEDGGPEYSLRRASGAHLWTAGVAGPNTCRAEAVFTYTHLIIPSRRCESPVPLIGMNQESIV